MRRLEHFELTSKNMNNSGDRLVGLKSCFQREKGKLHSIDFTLALCYILQQWPYEYTII